MKLRLVDFLNDINNGEIVFVEYRSTSHPELLFEKILSWAEKNGLSILIIDVLDTFHLFMQQLRFMGHDTSSLETLPVIKAGGRVETRNIIGRIRIMEEFYVYLKEYNDAVSKFFERVSPKKAAVVFLGTEKFMYSIQDSHFRVEEFFDKLIKKAPFKGNITFVFALTGLMNEHVKASWYECSTRIITLNERGDQAFVKKAPKLNLLKEVIEV